MQDTISYYRIDSELGRGGMGVVYRALDTRLRRPVALKVLPPEFTSDPDRHQRFVQEARAASALNHPSIVTIYEIGEDAGTTFIAMELVDGEPLDRILARGPLPLPRALELAVQIAAALEAAHAAGIVHRDIKPANIVVSRDGLAKVLDFGLAKLVERAASEATLTAVATQPGTIVGTAAYMSPEQAEGRPVTARSDIFSFGAVLYEMFSGRRPFTGTSDLGVITAILRDDPAPLRALRSDVPVPLETIVRRALAKDASTRYATAGELRTELAQVHARLTRPPDPAWRRPALLVPAAVVLVAAAGFGVWQMVQARRVTWAREVALPEIERLHNSGQTMTAVRLARDAERYVPAEVDRIRDGWLGFPIETEPPGAEIAIRNYGDLSGPWEPFGQSPLRVRLPFGYYRVRVSKQGYAPLEVSAGQGRSPVKLTPEGAVIPDMVFVPGGSYSVGIASPVTLPDYWIDRLEVTNAEYKRFVDAGGYRNPEFWTDPFVDAGRTLSFEEAVGRFTDPTGQPGPATWELGSHPEGQGDHPVGGISWFEAAAYARFAGKSLPSLYHWFKASGTDEIYSDILQLSNFDGKGPVKAGERQGVGPWGTLDMAGNVKEWCANGIEGAERRYILGGGWNEPSYRFREEDAQNPWGRMATYGVRLVKNLGPADHTSASVARVRPSPDSVVPISDEMFRVYASLYRYDRLPLDARTESVDDGSPHWTKETVSFAAAYGNERVPAFLFLPKNATPPFQTIVLFPSAYARNVPTSQVLDLGLFEFIVRSGRALLYPVYQGTYERRGAVQPGPSGWRDIEIQWAKDFFRAVDFLETRKEVDIKRLGYYSVSMGAYFGPIPVSLEPRITVAVFASGGLRYTRPPETQPANFAPHVRVPVLLINGKDDFSVSPAEQLRFLELMGTAPEHKRRVSLEGGHVPQDIRGLFRETLAWYDKYLGPVR